MIKHILTEEDLRNNPELVEQGFAPGDEIELSISGANKSNKNGGDVPPKPPTHP